MVKCNHRDVPDHTQYWDCWDIPWEGSTGPVRSDPLARFQWSGVVRADIVFSFGKPVRPVLWVGVDSTRLDSEWIFLLLLLLLREVPLWWLLLSFLLLLLSQAYWVTTVVASFLSFLVFFFGGHLLPLPRNPRGEMSNNIYSRKRTYHFSCAHHTRSFLIFFVLGVFCCVVTCVF